MLSSANEFIIDAVAHPYNHSPENYAEPVAAGIICDLAYGFNITAPDPAYAVPRNAYISDWSMEDTAKVLFAESPNDMAVVHTLPFGWFKDSYCSVEKSAEAIRRWPHRFRAYASIDPLRGEAALEDLERQVELLKPTGLKVYPVSWNDGVLQRWRLDDPKIAFPIFERAMELGIKVIAVHKAVPVGPVVSGDAFEVADVEGAAGAFPDLAFEIVHGGLAFAEETAWLLARFPNVFVNMEVLNYVLERRPRTFSKMLLEFLSVGGSPVYDRLIWASGCVVSHPRPSIEALCGYQIDEDLLEGAGMFMPVEQINDDHKRNILSGNWARMHGMDIEAAKAAIRDANDEFSQAYAADPLPTPWSTTSKWDEIQEERRAGAPAHAHA